jgi:hypothetical protein
MDGILHNHSHFLKLKLREVHRSTLWVDFWGDHDLSKFIYSENATKIYKKSLEDGH